MAIYTTNFFSGNTTIVNQTSMMVAVQNAFKTFGWQRTADAGQVSPGGTAVAISAATGNGSTATYTYNAATQAGPPLQVGMTITTTGCTTAGFNTTTQITAVGNMQTGASATFSTTNSTNATEAETAFGVVNTFVPISAAVGNGKIVTFTYDDTQVTRGGQLLAGMTIVVTGTTHGSPPVSFDGTYLIQTVSPVGYGTSTATFTAYSPTVASNTGLTASGNVTAQTTAQVNTYYDIWQSQDSLTPYYIRFNYAWNLIGGVSFQQWTPNIQVGMGTEGNGTLTGAGVNQQITTGSVGTPGTEFFMYASGNKGSVRFLWWMANQAYFAVERANSNAGAPSNSYVTVLWGSNNGAFFFQQSLFLTGQASFFESNGWIAALPKTSATGNVGTGTIISPVFPMVGLVGNPLQGTLLYRGVDFTSLILVPVTVYNVTNNYLTVAYNNSNMWVGAAGVSLLMLWQ